MQNKQFIFGAISFHILLLLSSCVGTINTIKHTTSKAVYKKAYIVSAENSKFINFRFGSITPYGYVVLPDNPARKMAVIGNTSIVIKMELEKHGIQATIGNKDDIPNNFDLIVMYSDTWRWDAKKILDKLEIVFVSPDGTKELARSTFNIYKNKELHDFPTPEKEVPKMIDELLAK